MNIVNLTPHAIVVQLPDGTRRTFPPSGRVARVATRQVPLTDIDGIPTVLQTFGPVEGLPEPELDTFFLVSALVLGRAARADVIAPDTGATAIRENGQIVAVRGFVTQGRII